MEKQPFIPGEHHHAPAAPSHEYRHRRARCRRGRPRDRSGRGPPRRRPGATGADRLVVRCLEHRDVDPLVRRLLVGFFSSGAFRSGQAKDGASQVFNFFTTDTKLTWQQIGADLLRGETLGQIAGSHAAKVEADALAEVKAGLSLGVVKGVITSAQETRLVNDAQDAISVLMAAKLSALLPAGR